MKQTTQRKDLKRPKNRAQDNCVKSRAYGKFWDRAGSHMQIAKYVSWHLLSYNIKMYC